MDNIILTSFSLEELAEAVSQKLSTLNSNTKESSSNTLQKKLDDFLTCKETAKLCKIKSPTTLWNWKQQGKLVPTANSGRKPLYLRSDIVNFLNGVNKTINH